MDKNIKRISELFKSDEQPIVLLGGQGNTYRAGGIIIKPALDKTETEEVAQICDTLPASGKIRLPRPVKSVRGNWTEEGYAAWTYLEGEAAKGRYKEQIEVCDAFNEMFRNVDKPKFIDTRSDPWAIADRVAWGESPIQYENDSRGFIRSVQSALKPSNLPCQIVYGDLAGNIIFSKEKAPGVIDITLYWRPADYAKALLVVDAITWEDADIDLFFLVEDLPEINQLLLRSGLRGGARTTSHERA